MNLFKSIFCRKEGEFGGVELCPSSFVLMPVIIKTDCQLSRTENSRSHASGLVCKGVSRLGQLN